MTENKKPNNKSKQITDRQTLENLHKKAQDLLNIGSVSSTSSETSSSSEEKVKPPPPRKNKLIENSSAKKASAKVQDNIDHLSKYSKYNGQIETNAKDKVDSINLKDNDSHKFIKAKVSRLRNDKIKSHTKLVKETATTISGR